MREKNKKWPLWIYTEYACISTENLQMIAKERVDVDGGFVWLINFIYNLKGEDCFLCFKEELEMERCYELICLSLEAREAFETLQNKLKG